MEAKEYFEEELKKINKKLSDLTDELNTHKKEESRLKTQKHILELDLSRVKAALEYLKG